MRFIPLFLSSTVLLAGISTVQTQTPPLSNPAKAQPLAQAVALLPDAFAGWKTTEAPRTVTDPSVADSAGAAALKEYGFTDGMLASYKHGDETLRLRALRFQDASGAYGAYSFYRQNGWPKEEIGTGAASNRNRVLFWLGNTVVDANFSQHRPHVRRGVARTRRPIAAARRAPRRCRRRFWPICRKDALDAQTTHYAVGPAGYAGAGGVLPPELVGFDRGAEAVTANYTLRSGPATLTIIDYPTPQMAAAQETRIRAYIKAGRARPQPPWPKPLQDSDRASLEVRRSGPLVALVSGDAIPDESHKLLATVHFEADLMSISAAARNLRLQRPAKLLLGIITLVIIGAGAAILLGSSLAAAGRFTGWRAASRSPRSTKRSSSASICEIEMVRQTVNFPTPHESTCGALRRRSSCVKLG